MTLGYALLHSHRVQTALDGTDQKVGFEDGVDVVMASTAVEDLTLVGQAFADEFFAQVEEIGGQFKDLVGDQGPFGWVGKLAESFSSAGANPLELIEKFSNFLCHLDPVVVRGLLLQFIDQLGGTAPILERLDLARRIEALITSSLKVFEGPFLAGRDDLKAHRGYRAGLILRNLIEPLLDKIDELFVELRPLDQLRHAADLIPQLEGRIVEGAQKLGCWIHTSLKPLFDAMRGFSASVTVSVSVDVSVDGGGPSGMADAEPTYRDDKQPTPHPRGHYLWALDLVTNLLGLLVTIGDVWRTASLRGWDVFSNICLIAWQALRTFVRAWRPDFLVKENNFGTWLFTEWGNFTMQFVLHFIGSFSDIKRWSNWTMSMGQRVAKFVTCVLQFRLPYLFARSKWFVDGWREDKSSADRPKLPFARHVWLVWPIVFAVAILAGFILGLAAWKQYTLEGALGGVVGLVAAVVGWLIGHITAHKLWIKDDFHPDYELEPSSDLFGMWAAPIMLFIGVEALSNTKVGEENKWLPWVLRAVYLVVAALTIAPTLGETQADADTTKKWVQHQLRALYYVGTLFVAGILPTILWWFYIDEGWDKEDVFDGLDRAKSPYLLPYAKGDRWMCGQGFHGIFSHTYKSMRGVFDNTTADNLYAYDFNEYEFEPAHAAREGIVVSLDDPRANGDPSDANEVQVMHLGWADKNDPGTSDERYITYTRYLHLTQKSVRAHVSQRVLQGYHLANIDDTGISAQHHLHFQASVYQRTLTIGGASYGRPGLTVPVLFRDSNLAHWRPWWGHTDGKPRSMSFFESDNQPSSPAARAVAIEVVNPGVAIAGAPAATPVNHGHELRIRMEDLPADTANLPANLVFATTVSGGHYHVVKLSKAQLLKLLGHDEIGELSTEPALQHTHKFTNDTPATKANVAGKDVALAVPPSAQLLATKPEPYDLLGEKLVLRVNDRTTEIFDFGAHRASLRGDIALDRSPDGRIDLSWPPRDGGTPLALAIAGAKSVRAAARDFDATLAANKARVARLEPALVIESRLRGSSSSLTIAVAQLATLGIVAAQDQKSQGGGTVVDAGAIAIADLVELVRHTLDDAPTAPPAGLVVQTDASGRLEMSIGGAAISDFSKSSSRVAQVFGAFYDAAQKRTVSGGAVPLSSGRLELRTATKSFVIPIAATPARVRITDPAAAFLSPADALRSKPLVIKLSGGDQNVNFQAADSTLAEIAARVMCEAEGVRAWVDGGAVVIESVAAGKDVSLGLSKDAPTAGGAAFQIAAVSGETAPVLAGTFAFGDSTALATTALVALKDDAVLRANTPKNNPAVSVTAPGGKLTIERANAVISAVASGELASALGAAQPSGPATKPDQKIVFANALGAIVALQGSGWLDVVVDGKAWRVPIEAEPARVEIGSIARLPKNGESLTINVDGADRTVSFTADVSTFSELAHAISKASDKLTARVAYRLVFELDAHGREAGTLELATSSQGLASAGFLSAPPMRQGNRRSCPDHVAASRADIASMSPARFFGALVAGVDVSVVGNAVRIAAKSGQTLELAPENDTQPFAFVPQPAKSDWLSKVFDKLDLGRESVGYKLRVTETGPGGVVVGGLETRFSLDAEPAVVAATSALDVAALQDTALVMTIGAPNQGDVRARVEFKNLVDAGDVVALLQREIPLCAAWLTNATADRRLRLATRGGGSGWKLKLEGPRALAALGFSFERIAFATLPDGTRDFENGSIDATGRGNVVDGRQVTRDELVTAVTASLAFMTRDQDRPFLIGISGADLVLSSSGKSVSVVSDTFESTPPGASRPLGEAPDIAARMSTLSTAGGVVTIGPADVDLLNGWLHVKVDGVLAAAVPIFGSRARIEKTLPPDPNPDVLQLAGQHFTIRVDADPALTVTLPTATATIESAVASMAAQVPKAWIGLVSDGTSRFLRIESRRRGKSSLVEVDFSSVPAANWGAGRLGFTTPFENDGGTGSVADLARVTRTELEALLRTARNDGAAKQAVVQAASDAQGVRVQAGGGPAVQLRVPSLGSLSLPGNFTAVPGDVQLVPDPLRPDVLVHVAGTGYADKRSIEPSMFFVRVDQALPGAAKPLFTRSLFHGEPARMDKLGLPADMKKLNGKTLSFSIDGVRADLDIAGLAGLQPAMRQAFAQQIEVNSQWRLRAAVVGTDLLVETVHEGKTAKLQVTSVPSGKTDAMTVLSGPTATSEKRGTGFADDTWRAAASEFAVGLNQGYVSDDAVQDAASVGQLELKRPYEPYTIPPRAATHGIHVRFLSARNGCMSSIVALTAEPAAFKFDSSLSRAPAIGAAAALAPFDASNPLTAKKNLSGDLFILLNDSSGSPDFAPAQTIAVHFDAADYTAAQVAEKIHAELYARGAGCAGVFGDGTIVIESLTRGIAGSIEVPAPNPASTNTLVQALGLDTQPQHARGWPQVGGAPNGFRSQVGVATKGVGTQWKFIHSANAALFASVTINAAHTLESLVQELDDALRQAGPAAAHQRIGMCRKGADGALFVEAMPGVTLDLEVNGQKLAVVEPKRPWEGHDLAADPGLDLRPTGVLRTYRLAYDTRGKGLAGEIKDELKWVRPPTDDVTARPVQIEFWPDGGWLVAARADAARTDGYKPEGEMIVSGGSFTSASGEVVAVAHRARYWIAIDFPAIGLKKVGSEVLVHVIAPK